MSLFNNASDVYINNNKVNKIYLNGNQIWSPEPVTTPSIDNIRLLLTTSLTTYDNAIEGNWIKVSKTEYDNIANNLNGVIKKGNTDTQVNTRDVLTSWANNWISFGTNNTPTFQINEGEYVIAMITETWNQPGGYSQLGYTTSFNGNDIINIANQASPSTGGTRDYFIRKKPSDVATETRYPVLFQNFSPNGVSGWSGYRSSDNGTTWLELTPGAVSKIQLLTTSIKTW